MVIRLVIACSFLEWFCENFHETDVLSPVELKRLVHLFISGLTFIPMKVGNVCKHALILSPH